MGSEQWHDVFGQLVMEIMKNPIKDDAIFHRRPDKHGRKRGGESRPAAADCSALSAGGCVLPLGSVCDAFPPEELLNVAEKWALSTGAPPRSFART